MVRFRVNSMLPRCAVLPVGGSKRRHGLCGGRDQTVTGRRGGYTVAAGRTVLAASPASFDCLVLCSAFHGAQLQGLEPDSLPDPVTCLPLLPGQVEVAPQSSCRGTMGGAESGEEEPGLQAGGHTAPGWQPLGPHSQGRPHIPGPPQRLAPCITHHPAPVVSVLFNAASLVPPTPPPITSEVLGSMESRHHQQGSLRQLVPDCGPRVLGWCHLWAGGCLCQPGDWEGSGGDCLGPGGCSGEWLPLGMMQEGVEGGRPG